MSATGTRLVPFLNCERWTAYYPENASTHLVAVEKDSHNRNSDHKSGKMFKPGNDGTAERPFSIRSWDEMIEILRQTAGDDKTVVTMRAVKVARHVYAVYWAQIHWKPEFQWSTTYHKTHFDLSSMGFWKRYRFRCLSLYVDAPESVEEQGQNTKPISQIRVLSVQ